jgi:hypothetical protein
VKTILALKNQGTIQADWTISIQKPNATQNVETPMGASSTVRARKNAHNFRAHRNRLRILTVQWINALIPDAKPLLTIALEEKGAFRSMVPKEPTVAWRIVTTIVPHFMIVQKMAQLASPKRVVADLVV